MDLSAIILADSRFPGGGHVHSGGLEEAVARKLIEQERDLPGFLSGRLRTAGSLAAVFAAASAHAAARGVRNGHWRRLDLELDARTPSLAQREASRAQGRGTARAGKAAWPSPVLSQLLKETPRPHHPVIVGVPFDAAMAVAYLAISGPASAAVRLLGLDPFAVNAVVARLSAEVREVSLRAAEVAGNDPADLPAPGSPALDLFAEAHARHHQEEVRLFAS
ncbi:urease accessory protein UreF [Amycolatopsis regifaucium]|uniref:Urease accessory protein UreF n=1 Tax=Amycolatopsis regifaucium TaxID=546365 RepID=A0A154MSP3_9PSEU|nr:urease accessory UreF family protein [Amycolatopsis regifaucium]KZB87306.1 urease accessory protein UreF [Amycolatopsis regifaucium]OKA08140.1 urease accessory protein UreF [Amycolatopsis regifaucium]SFI40905.1 urease accessory protein [Amycolatopsis regifaucium]